MKTRVSKEDFMKMPQKEQNYLILGAVEGHEERITKLESQKLVKTSIAFVGGVFGGILAKIGLG